MAQGPHHTALCQAVDVSLHDMQVLFDVHKVLSGLIDACRARVLDATDQPHRFTHGVPGTQKPFEITRVLFFVSVIHFKWLPLLSSTHQIVKKTKTQRNKYKTGS